MKKITILIAEDHTLVRETWCSILNDDDRFQVVAACGDGGKAVAYAGQLRPDIVMMDINLPDMNGFRATRLIRQTSPRSKVLGVSIHNEPMYARKMIEMGASGYVTKNCGYDELIEAIINVYNSHVYICRELRENMLTPGEEASQKSKFNLLSRREVEIANHLVKGRTSKEIAETLDLAHRTIEVHRYNILKKLNLSNTAALINFIHSNRPLIDM